MNKNCPNCDESLEVRGGNNKYIEYICPSCGYHVTQIKSTKGKGTQIIPVSREEFIYGTEMFFGAKPKNDNN